MENCIFEAECSLPSEASEAPLIFNFSEESLAQPSPQVEQQAAGSATALHMPESSTSLSRPRSGSPPESAAHEAPNQAEQSLREADTLQSSWMSSILFTASGDSAAAADAAAAAAANSELLKEQLREHGVYELQEKLGQGAEGTVYECVPSLQGWFNV